VTELVYLCTIILQTLIRLPNDALAQCCRSALPYVLLDGDALVFSASGCDANAARMTSVQPLRTELLPPQLRRRRAFHPTGWLSLHCQLNLCTDELSIPRSFGPTVNNAPVSLLIMATSPRPPRSTPWLRYRLTSVEPTSSRMRIGSPRSAAQGDSGGPAEVSARSRCDMITPSLVCSSDKASDGGSNAGSGHSASIV
jgi:hypothetical protein